ncbi:MAG: Clp protease N-terminal domain-containing protein [Acidimicrobiales bacterium]
MFERFTDRARRVLVLAKEEGRQLNHSFIGTEHILLGLIGERDGIAAQALRRLEISGTAVRAKVEETIGPSGSFPSGPPPFTPRAKKVLELALREALQLGHSYIGTEHLLLGVVREGNGVGARVLVSLGADLPRVRQQVIHLLGGEHGGMALAGSSSDSPPRIGGFHRTVLVVCSFCGLRPPESGRLVSGDNAFICERCIRQWSDRLETEPGPVGPVVSHVYVAPSSVEAPKDAVAARAEIAAAFAGLGTLSSDGRSVPTVERGNDLGPVLVAARERGGAISASGPEVTVDEIVFVGTGHAAVWFSISVDGRSVLQRHHGDAVLVNDTWKVARSTFCGLMGLAGVSCPPETD